MRLTDSEIRIIKETVKEFYGLSSKVFVFGSRVENSRKGGDIDLYIESESESELQDKISFISQLKWVLGDQKIDVIVKTPNMKDRKIFHIARHTGVEL